MNLICPVMALSEFLKAMALTKCRNVTTKPHWSPSGQHSDAPHVDSLCAIDLLLFIMKIPHGGNRLLFSPAKSHDLIEIAETEFCAISHDTHLSVIKFSIAGHLG